MNFLYPLLAVLLAIFAIAPLEYPGAFQSHSGLIAAYNLINLDQNPWQFLTWAPTVGHVYDIFRTEGALPYLLAELTHLLGLNYLDSIKLVYAAAWAASGLTMYALGRRLMSQPAALLASIIYVYLPFHVAAVYVRGAFAESVAWALLPLALLAAIQQPTSAPSTPDLAPLPPSPKERGSRANLLHLFPLLIWRGARSADRIPPTPLTKGSEGEIIRGGGRDVRSAALALLPFALLFLTQPGLSILFCLVALLIMVCIKRHQPRALIDAVGVVLGGMAVGALYSLPSIVSHGAGINPSAFVPNYVLPFQLFSSLWGYGVSTGNFLDRFPLQLGIVPLGLTICAVALGWANRDPKVAPLRRLAAVCLAIACVLAILTFEISSPIWRGLGTFASYPWQLISFVGLLLALAAATIVDLDLRLAQPTMLAVLLAVPVVAVYGYLAPRFLDFTPTRPLIAVFGNNEIALLDYRIVGPLRHGATVRLEMEWQALRPVDHDYTVFVHAVNEDGQTYGQVDEKPVGGTLPTLRWSAGQVISDTHTVQIDVDGPREGYLLQVGLYYGAMGQRAVLEDGSDYLALPRPQDPEPIFRDPIPIASEP